MSGTVWEWKMSSPGGFALGMACLAVEFGLVLLFAKWRNRQ